MKFASTTVGTARRLARAQDLSEASTNALEDIELHLEFLGKSELDEEAFHELLDDIGYKRSKDGLFDSLLEDIALATGSDEGRDGIKRSSISIEDLSILYGSESYHLLDNGMDPGHALMVYAEHLFESVDADSNGSIDIDEAFHLIEKLTGDIPTQEEAEELVAAFDKDNDGEVSLAEFKNGILRSNKNTSLDIPRTFNHNHLLPTQTSSSKFVGVLEEYAENHRAVRHHFLESVACASFGKWETATTILLFLTAYAKFNSGFVENLHKLIAISPKEDREVLEENLSEEMGIYDEDTLKECESLGISRKSVEGINHHQLFLAFVKTIESKVKCSFFDYVPESIMEDMFKAKAELQDYGKIGLLAALYFGSELIVPLIYSSLLSGLKLCLGLTNEEASFLHVHIAMDSDHADSLREIVIRHCETMEDRIAFFHCTEVFLNARVASYDNLGTIGDMQGVGFRPDKLYDKQALKWSRDDPRCLNVFTGRSVVYEMIKEHIDGASVLDVGCGEGCVSRALTEMGARKIVGLDISSDMIEKALTHKDKAPSEHYLAGDATDLKKTLQEKSSDANIMLGAQFDIGTFDLSIAVFLFNYMSISSMNKSIDDVFSLLKPGGHFVLSVPHPFMASNSSDTFGFGTVGTGKYFALRDKCLDGQIDSIDGDKLNVKMQFKTIEDYITALVETGFEVVDLKEARVNAGDLLKDKQFFRTINGIPLNLVIKVRKPTTSNFTASLANQNTLDLLPKKINWSNTLKNHADKALVLTLPLTVGKELVRTALSCYKRGISVEELNIGRDLRTDALHATVVFAKSVIRKRLLHETGAVIVRGLDMDALGGVKELDKMTECSKVAYFILSEYIGTVDATTRGKLFDVKSANVDSSKADNVLFSVSNTEAGWHTDGASKDRVYDVVALLCISPAATGGRFRVSNACDAFDELSRKVSKFLMHELTRPIPRDVLENGKGNGTVGVADTLSRTSALLSMRIKYNSYPIYVNDGDRMRFRYMRHWIETGHKKVSWKVSTLLRIAMDLLDDHLDEACCFYEALKRGDMIFANNSVIAHARDQFENAPGKPPRHKVRAWIQIQKAEMLSDEESMPRTLLRSSSVGASLLMDPNLVANLAHSLS